MTHRQFLASAATATAGLCLFPIGKVHAAAEAPAEGQVGMLVDVTRCICCRACTRACNERNSLPRAEHPTTVWDGPVQTLTYNQWTIVNREGTSPSGGAINVKKQCMHCLDPACVSVCPVGAMRRLPSGAVIYRQDRCVGCRYCLFACPFGIPKFEWDSGLAPVVGKCQFCAQQAPSLGPACAAACPTGTLKFGARATLLTEAKARIHARPDRYVDHLYGEREAGGTAWLYLSSRPFSELKLAEGVPTEDLPSLTRMALQVIPAVVTVLAVALSFLSAAVGRAAMKRPES